MSVLNLKKKTSLKRLESEPALKKYEVLESYTEAVQSSIERPTLSNQHPISVTLQNTAIWKTFYLKLDSEPLDDFLDSDIKILDKTNDFLY